jgi:RimJ/RimL family protein N-acetyltransferase
MATPQSAQTARLDLRPFSDADFGRFVAEMLTDPRVTEFYFSYKDVDDLETIRQQADKDFRDHFEDSRTNHGLEIWAAYEIDGNDRFVGWSGLLHTSLSEKYGGPELQYMIAGDSHGRGYATEIAAEVLRHADEELDLKSVIATVDIPNTGSIRVLEKLGFEHEGQIEAYGSNDMFLYRRTLNDRENSR